MRGRNQGAPNDGVGLAILSASGLIIYLTMCRPNQTGLRRVFW